MQANLDELFCRTLDDLQERVLSQDPYEILGASALIRKLFFDDHPLIDQINRDYRIKIIFDVAVPPPLPEGFPKPSFWTLQDGLDPETAKAGNLRTSMNRDQFFRVPLVVAEGKEWTIREIILFEANVMGGVHAGSSKKEKEMVLEKINSTFMIGGYRLSLRQLKAVGRVVLKSLIPLRKAVEANS